MLYLLVTLTHMVKYQKLPRPAVRDLWKSDTYGGALLQSTEIRCICIFVRELRATLFGGLPWIKMRLRPILILWI